MSKKIFILLPDGVGLRNFAYTHFHEIGIKKGNEIVFWNYTPFSLKELGFDEIVVQNPRLHPLTDFYKKAQIQIELSLNIKRAKDNVYNGYRFPISKKNLKEKLKYILLKTLILKNNSNKGIERVKNKIKEKESKTKHYFDSLETLKSEKPDFVFCTNQRITQAVAPILAAQDLGIPTATFIFSWDNLPKGTKILDTDYYFVWSNHMKDELKYYYPYIKEEQIFVTGTTQFEPHFEKELLVSKEKFFNDNNLDANKKYICFSGDDITTSPYDEIYLEDTAKAVEKLNQNGHNLGIIFRRCPVDFSNRYDAVLNKYSQIITPINPKWKKMGELWNSILPTKEDYILQVNTIKHSEFVVNIASSMVFDFIAFNKPCCYFNYEIQDGIHKNWSVNKIYKFIHFRSMPDKNSVYWLTNPDTFSEVFEGILKTTDIEVLENAKKWFEKINLHPANKASERIWNAIEKVVQ